jgi:hypothetical protein
MKLTRACSIALVHLRPYNDQEPGRRLYELLRRTAESTSRIARCPWAPTTTAGESFFRTSSTKVPATVIMSGTAIASLSRFSCVAVLAPCSDLVRAFRKDLVGRQGRTQVNGSWRQRRWVQFKAGSWLEDMYHEDASSG